MTPDERLVRLGRRLGRHATRARKKRKRTQAEVAATAGTSREYLASIEGGTRLPSLPLLERLARALKVRMADLLR